MQIFHNANYDFIRWRWHALVLSSVVIIGGLALALARGGMPLGIDFTGGTHRRAAVRAAGHATPPCARRSTRCPARRSCSSTATRRSTRS